MLKKILSIVIVTLLLTFNTSAIFAATVDKPLADKPLMKQFKGSSDPGKLYSEVVEYDFSDYKFTLDSKQEIKIQKRDLFNKNQFKEVNENSQDLKNIRKFLNEENGKEIVINNIKAGRLTTGAAVTRYPFELKEAVNPETGKSYKYERLFTNAEYENMINNKNNSTQLGTGTDAHLTTATVPTPGWFTLTCSATANAGSGAKNFWVQSTASWTYLGNSASYDSAPAPKDDFLFIKPGYGFARNATLPAFSGNYISATSVYKSPVVAYNVSTDETHVAWRFNERPDGDTFAKTVQGGAGFYSMTTQGVSVRFLTSYTHTYPILQGAVNFSIGDMGVSITSGDANWMVTAYSNAVGI